MVGAGESPLLTKALKTALTYYQLGIQSCS